MANPLFPNVPQLPGVPPVFRDRANEVIGIANDIANLVRPKLTHDAPGVAAGSRAVWGIYTLGGALALAVDSVVSVEPHREFRLSDYPTEKGGFQTFNKVATPRETRVSVTKGGSDADRQAFLDTLDDMTASLDLFSVVMPDNVFPDSSLVRYDYVRSQERGATLITVEISFTEVRQTATSAFTDSKAPAGSAAVQGGPVQAQPATAQQTPPPTPTAAIPPAVAAFPQITAAMPAIQRAAQVSQMIGVGATIGDIVAKGAGLLNIPVLATAAQSLTVQLVGQSVRLDLAQTADGLFADVYQNDALTIGGVLVQNDNPIIRSPYLGFLGDLIFHDTQGGLGNVSYADLGGRVALLFAGA